MQDRADGPAGRAASAMPAVAWADAHRWKLVETLQSTAIGATIAVAGIAPRALPVFLTVTALLGLLGAALQPGCLAAAWRASQRIGPQGWAVALVGYGAASALWASDRALALASVLEVWIVVAAAGVLAGVLPFQLAALPEPRRRRFLRAVPIGGAIALGFVLVEFATGHAVSLAAIGRFPGLMGDNAKDFVRQGDRIVGFAPFYLDRNIAALTLVLPAVALATRNWLRQAAARWALATGAACAIMAVGVSFSGAAKLALAAGAGLALLAVRWPAATRRGLQVALAAGILLALPLGQLPSRLGLETAPWAPPSMRERAAIWASTSRAALRAPPYGIGAQSTRHQADGERLRIDGVAGERRRLGTHAHNIVLQTWLELGLPGALLLLGLALSLARAAMDGDGPRSAAAVATLAMAAAIAATGWGMWQPWLVAACGTSVLGLVTAAAGRYRQPHDDDANRDANRD